LPSEPTVNPSAPALLLDEELPELLGGLAAAVELEQAGVMLGSGLLLATQVLPFQDHHRQPLFS
jgi:hypothetical protein